MLRPGSCSAFWAHGTFTRGSSDFRAAPSDNLFQQQPQMTMMHSEHLQSFGAARSRNSSSCSLASSALKFVSRPSVLKEGTVDKSRHGRKLCRSTGLREGRRRTAMGASGKEGRGGLWKEGDSKKQILKSVTVGGQGKGNREDGVVEVQIEKLGRNSRKIVAKISIEAPLDNVWAILTDYEHLADYIPGLAVNELLEKRQNGARLYQVGEQDIALGVKFKAKAVVDCEEKPTKVHGDFIRRDIDFETVEGDFQIFRGTWRMEQPVSKNSSDSYAAAAVGGGGDGEEIATILSYILVVQPKLWLPVGLVEGRLTSEVKTNLVCIRKRSLQPSLR